MSAAEHRCLAVIIVGRSCAKVMCSVCIISVCIRSVIVQNAGKGATYQESAKPWFLTPVTEGVVLPLSACSPTAPQLQTLP
jgi:hypothetical protein